MTDLRRLSFAACLLLVALRMAIGWQFLNEGIWKLKSQSTASPWSAEGYLRNAQGPLRKTFQKMTGNERDQQWLDYKTVSDRWDDWRRRFLLHYRDLTSEQEQELAELLDGPKEFSAPLAALPNGVEIKAKGVRYDAAAKRLVVARGEYAPGESESKEVYRLLPKERDDLLKQVDGNDSQEAKDFRKAVKDLYAKQARLSYRERLVVSLVGDPGRVGLVQEEHPGTVDFHRKGAIEDYQELRARFETQLAAADEAREWKQVGEMQTALAEKRGEATGPVRALEQQLKADAWKILTPEQRQLGPVNMSFAAIDRINSATIWSLIVLGGLLIAGLLTRPAAFLGAGLVLTFYLAAPPWPGLPETPGSVEHSLFVNKNLIEVLALLAIASLPTGQWFGIDRWFQRIFYGPREED